jgi:agmatinase
VVLVPVPWEATVSKGGGTARGPQAILEASHQVDVLDRETGRPYEKGIAMLPISQEIVSWNEAAKSAAGPVIHAGGAGSDPDLLARVARVNALGESLNAWVHDETRRWLERGKLVGVVGGDHSVPYGAIAAVTEKFPGLGILHVDAHADLRIAYEGFRWSHASIMENVRHLPGLARLVQVGIRDFCEEELEIIEGSKGRIVTHFDSDLRNRMQDGEPWNRIASTIVAELPEVVYVSFDIDGLDPALCPGTGTPVPGGLAFSEATALLRALVRAGKRIVAFDLNEVAPGAGNDWDANVGARILYKEIGYALLSNPG